MPQWPKIKIKRAGIYALLFLLGTGVGWTWAHYGASQASKTTAHYLRLKNETYPLINQLLACNINETTPSESLNELHDILENEIASLTVAQHITRAAIYIRGLEDGTWTSIHGDDLFIPASLMKIVKLIAFLNEADQNPDILEKTVTVPLDLSAAPQNIAPTASAIRGETYTVRQLLELAIIHSDNVAVNALSSVIDPDILEQTLDDLEIPGYDDVDKTQTYTISPRLYSRFFRVLYNSTLLSPEHSELALEWLSQSEYKDALVKGVNDPTIRVAHKFGETLLQDEHGTPYYQHHDCGIVYRDAAPYAVCIMTEGNDLKTLADSIATLEADIDTFIKAQ